MGLFQFSKINFEVATAGLWRTENFVWVVLPTHTKIKYVPDLGKEVLQRFDNSLLIL